MEAVHRREQFRVRPGVLPCAGPSLSATLQLLPQAPGTLFRTVALIDAALTRPVFHAVHRVIDLTGCGEGLPRLQGPPYRPEDPPGHVRVADDVVR